jgi:Zn-dependent M28 family amino/carboxypeptidase
MPAQTSRLYADVRFLTELLPERNFLNPESLDAAASHIRQQMRLAGLTVEGQHWTADGTVFENVIGIYNPGKPRTLVVGAHYDVCEDQPGADDNASAVAGLLELARLLDEHKPQLDYTVEFVSYCLEEPPYFGTESMGSFIHAKSLHDNKVDVIGMICLDMIGFFSDEPGSQRLPVPGFVRTLLRLPDIANFIATIGILSGFGFNRRVTARMAEAGGIPIRHIPFPGKSSFRGFAGLSDHRNYWAFGYDAIMVTDTAFLRNPNYHMPSDTIDTLDFKRMGQVVDAVYDAVVGMG